MSFALLRSALLCLRGSRSSRRIHLELSDIDFDIEKRTLKYSLAALGMLFLGNFSKSKEY